MSRCPCCGYSPDEESEPLFPNVGPGPFIPRVEVVGGANINALIDRSVTVDFNINGDPISVRIDEAMPIDEVDVGGIRVELGVDPNRKGGSG